MDNSDPYLLSGNHQPRALNGPNNIRPNPPPMGFLNIPANSRVLPQNHFSFVPPNRPMGMISGGGISSQIPQIIMHNNRVVEQRNSYSGPNSAGGSNFNSLQPVRGDISRAPSNSLFSSSAESSLRSRLLNDSSQPSSSHTHYYRHLNIENKYLIDMLNEKLRSMGIDIEISELLETITDQDINYTPPLIEIVSQGSLHSNESSAERLNAKLKYLCHEYGINIIASQDNLIGRNIGSSRVESVAPASRTGSSPSTQNSKKRKINEVAPPIVISDNEDELETTPQPPIARKSKHGKEPACSSSGSVFGLDCFEEKEIKKLEQLIRKHPSLSAKQIKILWDSEYPKERIKLTAVIELMNRIIPTGLSENSINTQERPSKQRKIGSPLIEDNLGRPETPSPVPQESADSSGGLNQPTNVDSDSDNEDSLDGWRIDEGEE